MGICDVKIPAHKAKVLEEAHKRVAVVKKQYEDGIITEGERHSKIISIWTEVSDKLSEELFKLICDTSIRPVESALFDDGLWRSR